VPKGRCCKVQDDRSLSEASCMENIAKLSIRSIRLEFLIPAFPFSPGKRKRKIRHLRAHPWVQYCGRPKTCGADWTRSAPPNHRSKQTSRFEALETRLLYYLRMLESGLVSKIRVVDVENVTRLSSSRQVAKCGNQSQRVPEGCAMMIGGANELR
jgi:hypothetical protein